MSPLVDSATHGVRQVVRAGLLLLVASFVQQRGPMDVVARLRAPSVAASGRVWLCPAFRREVEAVRATTPPASALTFIEGRPSYFVDEGEGWFAVRALDRPHLPDALVVTRGVFILKSELAR